MSPSHDRTLAEPAHISLAGLAMACLLGWGLLLSWLVGRVGWVGTLTTFALDGTVAALIFLSAGGWGWLALRWWMPRDVPGGLKAVTCITAGLWLLSTAVLLVGSTFHGALVSAVWWPILAAGLALALAGAAGFLRQLHLPRQLDDTAALWVLAALAAAFWVAGATLPAGFMGLAMADVYDVVSYHLQVPREYYQAGQIHFLAHNTYSQYPSGAEMLFLLGMVLRGGAHVGSYTAQLTHGLWGVLAIAAVYYGLAANTGEGQEHNWRRRASAVLLATLPGIIYLSWLAFVELSQVAYMAVGVVWLLRWQRKPGLGAAVLVGLACGGACATKYLSLGLVAGPLLAVMFVCILLHRKRNGCHCDASVAVGTPSGNRSDTATDLSGVARRAKTEASRWHPIFHLFAAAIVCAALMSPWLIRNYRHTGNPVFPLATSLLGRGHWSADSAAMWDAAHASVPWSAKPAKLVAAALDERLFGLPMLLLLGLAAIWAVARRRRTPPVDWICLALVGLQLLAWMLLTHMPGRFLIPTAVPMAIAVGGWIEWFAQRETSRPRNQAQESRRFPGRSAAALLVLCVGVFNLVLAWRDYSAEQYTRSSASQIHGWLPDEVARKVPASAISYQPAESGGRVLLVGDIRPFLLPDNTLYATVWEQDPLRRILNETNDPREILRRLQGPPFHVTHLWVNWTEIDRLHETYGWWPQINADLIDRLLAAGATKTALPEGVDPRLRAELIALPPIHD